MKNNLLTLLLLLCTSLMFAQTGKVTVQKDANGHTLKVDGKPFLLNLRFPRRPPQSPPLSPNIFLFEC